MNSPLHELNINSSLTVKLILSTAILITASASIAEESDIAYIDSVQKWGAWELDIEPAAGGLRQPTTKALNARDSKVVLRTNSFSALAPPLIPNTPIAPGTPITPTLPTITPINPNVPIPVGGPNDGF